MTDKASCAAEKGLTCKVITPTFKSLFKKEE